ncbi:hypothetical protein N7540_005287 [Penicillium herquei]|nr:hypothetical protein N7540_005287 [Penicillium herquei]
MGCWTWKNGYGLRLSVFLEIGSSSFLTGVDTSACQYGHAEVVKTSLENCVFSEHDRNRDCLTALMTAAPANRFEVTRLLLRYNAPLDAVNTENMTALHQAVHSGRLDFVELFIQHGANMEIQDKSGRTPLLTATESHSDSIADLLLRSGARVNHQDQNGNSPLHWAVRHSDFKMVQGLLRHSANTWATENDGLTAEALADKLINDNEGNIRQLLRDNASQTGQTWVTK